LENEQILQQFEAIDRKIEALIQAYKALEKENRELRDIKARLEYELQLKTETEKQFDEVKAQIRTKIDDLMTRLTDVAEDQ